jgi:hypothetical protein
MLNKVLAGMVVAFWVAMMAALVRLEIFPRPTVLETFPNDRILEKIFANPEPARLDVYYQNSKISIGFCDISIQPRLNNKVVEQLQPGQKPDSYEVITDLKMNLSMFGEQTRLYLSGKSEFNPKMELDRFDIVTTVGDSRVNITGNDLTKKVKVIFSYDGIHDERTFDFNQVKGAGFANAFGMPGLGNLGFLGGGMPVSRVASLSGGPAATQPVTITYFDRLEIAGDSQRVYLIDSKIDDQMWTKMWVDDSGQVLKVTTSLGLEMLSAGLTDGTDYQTGRPLRRLHRKE